MCGHGLQQHRGGFANAAYILRAPTQFIRIELRENSLRAETESRPRKVQSASCPGRSASEPPSVWKPAQRFPTEDTGSRRGEQTTPPIPVHATIPTLP